MTGAHGEKCVCGGSPGGASRPVSKVVGKAGGCSEFLSGWLSHCQPPGGALSSAAVGSGHTVGRQARGHLLNGSPPDWILQARCLALFIRFLGNCSFVLFFLLLLFLRARRVLLIKAAVLTGKDSLSFSRAPFP